MLKVRHQFCKGLAEDWVPKMWYVQLLLCVLILMSTSISGWSHYEAYAILVFIVTVFVVIWQIIDSIAIVKNCNIEPVTVIF
jgi:hypothetical protein